MVVNVGVDSEIPGVVVDVGVDSGKKKRCRRIYSGGGGRSSSDRRKSKKPYDPDELTPRIILPSLILKLKGTFLDASL